jgi:hypothetical protein
MEKLVAKVIRDRKRDLEVAFDSVLRGDRCP